MGAGQVIGGYTPRKSHTQWTVPLGHSNYSLRGGEPHEGHVMTSQGLLASLLPASQGDAHGPELVHGSSQLLGFKMETILSSSGNSCVKGIILNLSSVKWAQCWVLGASGGWVMVPALSELKGCVSALYLPTLPSCPLSSGLLSSPLSSL